MNFHAISQERKMHHWSCIALMLFVGCAMGSLLDNNYCYETYNHGCHTSSGSSMMEYRETKSHSSCSLDDVTDGIKFIVLLTSDGSSSSGIVKVNVTLPNAECNYGIALLVNLSITNKNDCNNNVFHKTNSYEDEIHSIERTVCVLPSSNRTSVHDCQSEALTLWYGHIFTGCYALRFTVDGYKYSVRGSTFLVTDYSRTEVAEPKLRCYYEDQLDSELSKELVRFVLRISVLADIAGIRLTLAPMSQHLDEIKENACIKYSESPLHTWKLITGVTEFALRNCSKFGNNATTKNMECNFVLRVPRSVSYCFQIVLQDARCHRQTIWKPPPVSAGGNPPCTWLQSCTRIPKNTSGIEYNGMIQDSKQINSEHILLLPIAITVILIILIVSGTILFVYRSHSRHAGQRVYVNINLRDLKISRYSSEIDSIETTDDEFTKGSNNGDECDAIILLYARDSPNFMSLMSDFREILKIYCGCHVRDWYAASEWDAVARIGPSAWVSDLLRQKYRVIWIDTPKVRSLLDMQWRNNLLNEKAVSDFRDIALPSILDLAKRNVAPELALQYTRHFVIRLEGFDAVANRNEDPFEDISPHTRYLIPYHLSDLCSHISSWRKNIDKKRLKTEEAQFRERLIRIKTNNS